MDSQEVKRWAYAYVADVVGEMLDDDDWPSEYRTTTSVPPAPTAEEMLPALRALRDELALQAGEPPRSRYEDWWRQGGTEGRG